MAGSQPCLQLPHSVPALSPAAPLFAMWMFRGVEHRAWLGAACETLLPSTADFAQPDTSMRPSAVLACPFVFQVTLGGRSICSQFTSAEVKLRGFSSGLWPLGRAAPPHTLRQPARVRSQGSGTFLGVMCLLSLVFAGLPVQRSPGPVTSSCPGRWQTEAGGRILSPVRSGVTCRVPSPRSTTHAGP